MVLHRETGEISHGIFKDLGSHLRAGDMLVTNETRVIACRLFGRKLPNGGRVEILLLRKSEGSTWEAIVGGKGLGEGKQIKIDTSSPDDKLPVGTIVKLLDGAGRIIQFDQPIEEIISKAGHVPLPPYIHTRLEDPERYQTVYAKYSGSAAAPTAGLHFTPTLIAELQENGILFTSIVLHVGLDTFAPVNEENPLDHAIHTEWCELTQENVEKIDSARKKGGRVIAVGTTTVRTLESAAASGTLQPFEGLTNLYIVPGYKFRIVDGMITNYHLPRSTLIMLVSAFAGRETILHAYEVAKQENYRFYSFGDAMLII
jgi:S-adenosylmethionine:tRNA ribosyltransferase-isomerase